MTLPSGTAPSGGLSYGFVSTVTDAEFDEASAALDRALLRAIGLPEDVEIREFENAVYAMTEKVKAVITNFSISKFIGMLPMLISDGIALWDKVEPRIGDQIERKFFISAVVRYVYKKHNPDLPVITEPFETMVEDMVLAAVPELIDGLEEQFNVLEKKLRSIFG